MIFSRLQRAKSIHHGPFIYLVTFCNQEKILDPSLKKVIKYFVVSLDMKFGCNVMYVCLLSWLGHTLALWFAKQDFLKKMTHGPKGVSKSAKNLFVSNVWEDMRQILYLHCQKHLEAQIFLRLRRA